MRGPCREPVWPAGVVGSITHCDGFCAAAVARKTQTSSLGIDAELIRPVSDDVLRLIATEPEVDWIRRAARSAQRRIPRELLLFSAKESVYKTWFPIMGSWLGFEQVRIEFNESENAFRAFISAMSVQVPTELQAMDGRFIVGPTHLMTCAHTYVN